jgi:hypothetical protein
MEFHDDVGVGDGRAILTGVASNRANSKNGFSFPLTFDRRAIYFVVECRGDDAAIYGFVAGDTEFIDLEDACA